MITKQVDAIYSRRARFYETAHRLTLAGWDTPWRQVAGWLCTPLSDGNQVIEFCAGQGHAAVECMKVWTYLGLKDIHVTGVEYNEKMILYGLRKLKKLPFGNRVRLVRGDVMDMLPGSAREGFASFEDATFDAAMCVFGVGGIESPRLAFREMLRVVKPGARVVVIDSHLPMSGLHTSARRAGCFYAVRLWFMRHMWGWENCPTMIKDIEQASYSSPTGESFGFEVIVKAICPSPRIIMRNAISVFTGVKVRRND